MGNLFLTTYDRSQALTSIRQALTPNGIFILETMVGSIDLPHVQSDHDGVIWTPYGEECPEYEPRVQREGLWYVPQRRLRGTKEELDEELAAAGFTVFWSHEVAAEKAGENGVYQAICLPTNKRV